MINKRNGFLTAESGSSRLFACCSIIGVSILKFIPFCAMSVFVLAADLLADKVAGS